MQQLSCGRILVVEDEDSIRRFIVINLKRNGYEVIEAASGEEALMKAMEGKPDLVVLDVMLPGMDGFEVCRLLREKLPDMAVIMLTARGQDIDKIMGLELGADDYVVKPFNPLELTARIRAVLRRIRKAGLEDEKISSGPFMLDLKGHRVLKKGEELDLTPREFDLMALFMKNPGKAFSRDEILNAVWGADYVGDPKTVDVHIRRLREKVEDDPGRPEYIETVWGIGYRWREKY
ncbi:response regulator transcription factor [Thermosediminibacter oceani]|uniref:Stage 0 sporulation protein A homolog n=1 Tax=Thermosediminibacter oceani (strain ATCC BAA-1034 / DSM 16646 / JW/IW-1228P) TaxID=555079 RepID=D9S0Q4_THEOJ|nr:response regulator transcription factor [Thermosediminibacter oceani]ADL07068.1 two component transcriptional regulator, winged helix family [Thermosediminibacter oceani DSM 16646]